MEKEILEEMCKKYCKRKRFILLLYRIAKTNKVNNIECHIKEFLKESVSKQCVKNKQRHKEYNKMSYYKKHNRQIRNL